MSTFWSIFIVAGTLGSLLWALWLLLSNRTQPKSTVETTGHEFDGIEELRQSAAVVVGGTVRRRRSCSRSAISSVTPVSATSRASGVGRRTSSGKRCGYEERAIRAVVSAPRRDGRSRIAPEHRGAADRPASVSEQLRELPRHARARCVRLSESDRRRVAMGWRLRIRRSDDTRRPHCGDAGMGTGARRRRRRRHGAIRVEPVRRAARRRRPPRAPRRSSRPSASRVTVRTAKAILRSARPT